MEILKYSLLSESFVLIRPHSQFLSVGLSMKHIQSCICGVLLFQVQWDICNQISHQTYLLKWHHLYHETGNAKDRPAEVCFIYQMDKTTRMEAHLAHRFSKKKQFTAKRYVMYWNTTPGNLAISYTICGDFVISNIKRYDLWLRYSAFIDWLSDYSFTISYYYVNISSFSHTFAMHR